MEHWWLKFVQAFFFVVVFLCVCPRSRVGILPLKYFCIIGKKLSPSKCVATAKVVSPCLTQFSRKDQGVYKAVLGDDRGKDTSVFEVSGQGTTVTLSLCLAVFHSL